ncbi:MAG TPA: 3-hydroxyacyl-CoA dehydrogenase/enoyl-CoA hydratase family protein [Bryobacteraceae bacterium]|jgi:3-hydroxyacyl-CoA dehydrogenase|nr:3-hydroxyacyl-CoA dehydrogenase/enoyl-CoA hydratase family protein [Bryobacteraceae bacterium]
MKPIRRVAVLGAGTMGSRIASHLANAQIPSLLLDLTLPNQKNKDQAARNGIDAALKSRPGAFFVPEGAKLITTGTFDDDIAKIKDCDWIIEAVSENLAIKRSLYEKVAANRTPGTVVSTNTSGIPLAQIADGHSDEFREHFLGTHFFNPPRYLHLAEIIPGPATSPEIISAISDFCDRHLGKGVVPCKDTPNFIANRIGTFFGSTVQSLTVQQDLTIEEVDALTGPLIGLPKSASYRLLDIVGIDVWAHVTKNLYDAAPHDPFRERFKMEPFIMEMIGKGWLGDKTGQGFFKRVGKDREIYAIDRKTLEYHPADKPRFASLEAIRKIEPISDRLKALIALEDKVGRFIWQLLSDHVVYAATMVPEISDRIVEIDRAMRWGYANELGPFELWDAMGFVETARRIESEGRKLPENIHKMLYEGAQSFYRPADHDGQPKTQYFDLAGSGFKDVEPRPGITVLADLKRARGVVKKNAGASLIDLGDGVVCCEFHGKMNAIGDDSIQMLKAGLAELESGFDAMVIGNQGENFSVGANLMMVLLAAQEQEWDEINAAIARFQNINMALKYAPKPVVAAPFGMSLGGGCEIPLHCARVQASAELYMGLVEVGVGLIPAGGGCKEMLLRSRDLRKVFEQIGYGKVSGSATEARQFKYLRESDGISMNAERLIDDAKQAALALIPNYAPGAPKTDIPVSGADGFAMMKMGLWTARQGEYISDYDVVVGEKLANVISGGRLTGSQQVSEQYLLDLEREAFLSLCGQAKTQERIQHMLKTGKPLRN